MAYFPTNVFHFSDYLIKNYHLARVSYKTNTPFFLKVSFISRHLSSMHLLLCLLEFVFTLLYTKLFFLCFIGLFLLFGHHFFCRAFPPLYYLKFSSQMHLSPNTAQSMLESPEIRRAVSLCSLFSLSTSSGTDGNHHSAGSIH